ncbi:divalent-cation tolerance protein CutA [Bacteroidota bacterium]
MDKVAEIRLVYVTTGTIQNAKEIAKILVSERLAACCSIIQNVISVFSWQNNIEERNEYMLIIKTIEKKLNQLEERVLQLSLDEVPEILSNPIDYAHKEYYDWLISSLD